MALGVIAVDDRTFVHYAHLQRNSVAMKTGQVVRRGRVIGRLGNSGIRTQHIFISTSLMVPHPKLHKGFHSSSMHLSHLERQRPTKP